MLTKCPFLIIKYGVCRYMHVQLHVIPYKACIYKIVGIDLLRLLLMVVFTTLKTALELSKTFYSKLDENTHRVCNVFLPKEVRYKFILFLSCSIFITLLKTSDDYLTVLYVLSTIQNCSIELISVQYKYEIVQFNKLLSGINIKVQVGFTKNNCRYNKPCANEVFSLSSGDTKSGTITGKRLFKLNHTFCFTNYL